jgi:type IV secretion system protein VirB6
MFSTKVSLLLKLGAPILVLYYGYSIMTPRGSNATIQEMMFNFVRIAIVFAFVENSAGLLDLSIGFIHELKTGFINEKSIFTLLDEQLLITQKLSQDVLKLDTGYLKLQGVLASLMIWLGATFVLASSAIIFIAAEVGLALLTVTSPIFIGCLTYGFTRELFNGWLRSIFSCIVTLIFATLVVKIGIDISNDIINQLAINPEQKNLMTIGEVALLTGIIVSSLVFVATKMAGNIAGVAATSAIQGGMVLGVRAGIIGAGNTAVGVGVATKYVGKGAVSVAKYANGKIKDKIYSRKLTEESQKAAFARGQQTNSQD